MCSSATFEQEDSHPKSEKSEEQRDSKKRLARSRRTKEMIVGEGVANQASSQHDVDEGVHAPALAKIGVLVEFKRHLFRFEHFEQLEFSDQKSHTTTPQNRSSEKLNLTFNISKILRLQTSWQRAKSRLEVKNKNRTLGKMARL